MKTRKIISTLCCVLMFAQVGFANEKIGVVDIQTLVSRSNAVQQLKQEHNSQLQSLNSIVTEAQNAISKETDPQKIVLLQDQYNAEFNRKKEAIDNQYKIKLSDIETNLRRDIIESAKKNNYSFVIAKNVVFLGGEDITELVAKDIK